jgi:hypothetical protein
MPRSRREFLAKGSLGLMGAAMTGKTAGAKQTPPTPGAPPAFGTSAPVGPAVSPATFAEGEKLMQVEMKPQELAQAAGNWQQSLASVYERRVGPRKLHLEETISPATVWNPTLPGTTSGPTRDAFTLPANPAPPLPTKDEDIAFAPVTSLSAWIKSRQLTSERLTNIYLKRLETFDPTLHCVITLTRDRALEQSPPVDIAARCTAFPGERKTSSTRQASAQPTAPSLTATASPQKTLPSPRASMKPVPSSSQN